MNNTLNTAPASDDNPFVSYTVGSTPEDVFAIPFQFWKNEDLTVKFDDVVQTGWNTTGAGNPAGGSLTLSGPVSDGVLTIQRYISEERTTIFPIAGPFRIEQLNDEFNHIIAMIADRRYVDQELHPVGSVYFSVVDVAPGTGQWKSLGSDTIFGITLHGWEREA